MKKIIWHNGCIVTMVHEGDRAEAMCTMGETIIAIGSRAEVETYADEETEYVDLEGKTLIPGLIEPHNHVTDSFINEFMEVACHDADTIARVQDHILENMKTLKAGEWVLGTGYNDSLVAEKRHLTRHDLDAVCPEIPVALFHVSGHVMYVNSKLIEIAGIRGDTPIPEGGSGRIEVDENGAPTGVLTGHAYMLAADKIPPHTKEKYLEAYTRGMAHANSLGITSVQDGSIGWLGNQKEIISTLNTMYRAGKLSLRFYLTIMEEQFLPLIESGCFTGFGDSRIRLGSVKFLLDGSIQAYTASLSQPYHTEGTSNGILHFSQEELDDAVYRSHIHHCQIAVHCNGDQAIEMAINAIEKAQKAYPDFQGRHILIHAQTIREDQLDRVAALNIIPSFFANHLYHWGDGHKKTFLGPERAARISPLASAKKRNIPFTIHTDYIVTPLDPFRLISSAVNRRTRGGDVLGPDQCVSVYDAVAALTVNAAYSSFEEDIKGSLAPGKLADFAVLSQDIFSMDPEKIHELTVDRTVLGGETIYENNTN